MNIAFNDEVTAKEYVLDKLGEKYDVPEFILKKEKYKENQVTSIYTCTFNDGNEEYEYYARAIQNGVMEDNYIVKYFRKDAMEVWERCISEVEGVEITKYDFCAPISSARTSDYSSYEDFRDNAKTYFKVYAKVADGYNSDTCIDGLMAFQDMCKELCIPVELVLRENDKDILWIRLWDNDKIDPKISEERFTVEMERIRLK